MTTLYKHSNIEHAQSLSDRQLAFFCFSRSCFFEFGRSPVGIPLPLSNGFLCRSELENMARNLQDPCLGILANKDNTGCSRPCATRGRWVFGVSQCLRCSKALGVLGSLVFEGAWCSRSFGVRVLAHQRAGSGPHQYARSHDRPNIWERSSSIQSYESKNKLNGRHRLGQRAGRTTHRK